MAFQAHNIPWTQLASHFKYIETNPRCWGITNYYAKRKPHPGNDIAYFVDCFAKTVEEHSRCERAKHNTPSTKPPPDHLVITDDVLKRVGPTVQGYRYTNSDPGLRSCASMYVRPTCPPSQYPVRDEDRTASMFAIPPRPGWGSSCRDAFLDRYHEFEYTAMIKTLLLHGEMNPLFQLAAYDPERVTGSWRMCLTDCQESDQGWREVRDLALYPFVCLNFLYAMRMASGNDDHLPAVVGQDYRNSKAYQIMLARCTGVKEFGCYIRDSALDPETFPHRRFFGVRKGRYRNDQYYPPKDSDFRSFYGKVPLARLQNMNGAVPEPYRPTVEDVDAVSLTLRRVGLPAEIASDILDRAEYTWQRRSRYADDPLHPDNRDELQRYLKFCWIVMVRCDVLAKACGKRLHWVDDVSHCVHDMFGVHDPRLRREEYDLGETDWQTDLMERRGWWIRWLAA